MKRDNVEGFSNPMNDTLKVAFTTPKHWEAFAALPAPPPHCAEFVTRNNKQVTDQVSRRETLPTHHSIGTIEHVLTRIRSNTPAPCVHVRPTSGG